MIEFLLAALPIVLLIVLMTKRNPVPSAPAFFLSALVAYLLRLFFFRDTLVLLNASVLLGALSALTPIAIVFGAILFFVAMERSGAMNVLRGWLHDVSGNRVAQLMVVGWSFQFLIEGASGFGTPAALAAPILVGLGFRPIPIAILCLVMNTIPVSFGAVGTPLWFGFGALGLDESQMLQVGWNTALLQTIAALVIPVVALRFAIGWKEIRQNLVFIYLSILASVGPMLALASINYEFPAVVGGLIGLFVTILLARGGVGLTRTAEENDASARPFLSPGVMLALAPLVATVVILLVTRIPYLGLRGWLTSAVPGWSLPLGSVGTLTISPSLVFELRDIFGQGLQWSHAFLYVPSIIPFLITAALALLLFPSRQGGGFGASLRETLGRIAMPSLALCGALIFVKLMMAGGGNASTMILGHTLADLAGPAWKYFAPFLGALGSFFSGSNTISNLTFGGIQYSIAQDTGVPVTTLLALQSAGGAMGNPVCIHNIVAVCAVLGIVNQEGSILKAGLLPVVLYGIIFALVALLVF